MGGADPDATPIFVIAGGPGQSAVALADVLRRLLRPVAPRRPLVLVERPGTGPGAKRCPGLSGSGRRLSIAAAKCAQRLGQDRLRLSTHAAVSVLERARDALGFELIDIYAVSYGSREALAYASAHPDRVGRMVLDSPVPLGGPDPFLRSTLRAIPRVLGALCRTGCGGGVRHPSRDLATLVRRLASSGDPGAKRRSALLRLFLAGEADPSLRRPLPGAIRAAVVGNPGPLGRLLRRSGSGLVAPGFNPATNAAVVCGELRLPWSRAAGLERRSHQLLRAVRSMPRRRIFPFDRVTLIAAPVFDLCRFWPRGPEPARVAAGPDVSTLILAGGQDLITPASDSRRLARQLPKARLLFVPPAGHTVLARVGPTSRELRAIRRFLAQWPFGR